MTRKQQKFGNALCNGKCYCTLGALCDVFDPEG